MYVRLRIIHIGQEALRVSNSSLGRDAGSFLFRSGLFHLLEPVNGKVTGAVFVGDDEFTLKPPIQVEQRYLAILAKGQPFEEHLHQRGFPVYGPAAKMRFARPAHRTNSRP
jgi:hypothetical protein